MTGLTGLTGLAEVRATWTFLRRSRDLERTTRNSTLAASSARGRGGRSYSSARRRRGVALPTGQHAPLLATTTARRSAAGLGTSMIGCDGHFKACVCTDWPAQLRKTERAEPCQDCKSGKVRPA